MVTVRLEENGPAYTIYRTGTFQIRGAETEELLTESFRRFEKVLHEIGVEASETEFRQVTSVFMEDIGREVNLEASPSDLGLNIRNTSLSSSPASSIAHLSTKSPS